jgi:hypothetical protein
VKGADGTNRAKREKSRIHPKESTGTKGTNLFRDLSLVRCPGWALLFTETEKEAQLWRGKMG